MSEAPPPAIVAQARKLGRALDRGTGTLRFPARGLATWSPERLTRARADLGHALEVLGEERSIRVEQDDAGSVTVVDVARMN